MADSPIPEDRTCYQFTKINQVEQEDEVDATPTPNTPSKRKNRKQNGTPKKPKSEQNTPTTGSKVYLRLFFVRKAAGLTLEF
jgi:exosome complex RNA-binding protein Csl4